MEPVRESDEKNREEKLSSETVQDEKTVQNGENIPGGETAKMEGEGLRIEELLEHTPLVQISPQGYSMYPMLIPGRDQAILEKAVPEKLKTADVILYRREDGMLVLHRLWKIRPEGYYTVGDNQTEVEGPLRKEQIKGRLTAFVRKGREIRVTNPVYLLAARIWLILRPVRDPIKKPLAALKRMFGGSKAK